MADLVSRPIPDDDLRLLERAELLSPAGDMERFRAAVDFGADAVYLAGKEFGMRSSPDNFGEELFDAVALAHSRNIRVYQTLNTVPSNGQLPRLPEAIRFAAECGVDAFIVTDLGVLKMVKSLAPDIDVHISTQAGVVNYLAANAFYELGAKRIVLARELRLEEIAEIRAKAPPELELEAFVHGAMCMSFSGRCLLSHYMTGRDANQGDCAQPCRWRYALVEEKRPGQYFPVDETDEGSFILNARDLCMIGHLPELLRAGVTSLKIEGRAKSAYYAAATTYTYRAALDFYRENGLSAPLPSWIIAEADKVSHRTYSTGFYLGEMPVSQLASSGYERSYEVIAVAEGWENGRVLLRQRNRFFEGETADCIAPGVQPFLLPLRELRNEAGEPIEAAPHPMMLLSAAAPEPIPAGTLLRRRA